MKIDFHTHAAWAPIYPPEFLDGLTRGLVSNVHHAHPGHSESRISALVWRLIADESGDRMVAQMDEAGIDRAVLLAIVIDNAVSPTAPPRAAVYAHYRHLLRRHPNRFVVFGGVDPRGDESSLALFRQSVEEWGFAGAKLYPPFGFRIDDARLAPYFEICSEHRLTALVHSSGSLPELDAGAASAHWLERIARQYPETNFVLAHAGYILDADSIRIAKAYPNVYLDISGFQTTFNTIDSATVASFGRIFEEPLNHKVLFASDWPLFNLVTTLQANTLYIERLFDASPHRNDSVRLERLFSRNAQKLLGPIG